MRVEFLDLGNDLDEPVSEAIEELSSRCLSDGSAEHLENMLGGTEGIDETSQIGTE